MEYQELKDFLDDNNLTHDEMEDIVGRVRVNNWKLEKILSDRNCDWPELNLSLLKSVLRMDAQKIQGAK